MRQSIVSRIAVIWLVLIAVFAGKAQLGSLLFGQGYDLGRHAFIAVLSTILTVPLIVLVWRHVDKRPFSELVLPLDLSAVRPILVGALAWLVPFGLGLAVCLGTGLVEIRATADWGQIFGFLPMLVLLVFLLEALPEELAFRGYLQSNLGRLVQPWLAVTLQAGLFGSWGVALWLISSGGIEPLHASMFYVMGAMLGIVRIVSGSLWTCIGVHVAFQTAAQLLQNADRGHFAIDGVLWLQVVALGVVPFTLLTPIIERFYRDRVDWTRQPV